MVIGITVGGLLLKVFTTPQNQNTIVLPQSPLPNDSTFGTGTYGSSAPTILDLEAEFEKITEVLEGATYSARVYRPTQGYIIFESPTGMSQVVVSIQPQSLPTVPDFGKGEVRKRMVRGGFKPKDAVDGQMVFLGTKGIPIYLYIVK